MGKVGLGGNPDQYIMTALFDNFADLEKFPQAFSKAAADAKLGPQPSGIVMHVEYSVMRYMPDVSIAPPDQPAAK